MTVIADGRRNFVEPRHYSRISQAHLNLSSPVSMPIAKNRPAALASDEGKSGFSQTEVHRADIGLFLVNRRLR